MLVIEYNLVGTIKRTDESLPEPSSQNQQDENTVKNATFATTQRSEESRLMQQIVEQPEQPEKLEPEPEDGHTEPKEAEQAGLSTPETTPAPEINVIDTTPTEAEHAERARSTLEAERPRGWTAVSADLRTNHIIDDKRPRKPSDRRAVYLSHLDGGLVKDNY